MLLGLSFHLGGREDANREQICQEMVREHSQKSLVMLVVLLKLCGIPKAIHLISVEIIVGLFLQPSHVLIEGATILIGELGSREFQAGLRFEVVGEVGDQLVPDVGDDVAAWVLLIRAGTAVLSIFSRLGVQSVIDLDKNL